MVTVPFAWVQLIVGIITCIGGLAMYVAAFEKHREEFAFFGPAAMMAGGAIAILALEKIAG
jgi:uncharacterized membrane protein HdeD (DUF308 family)